MQLPVHRTNRSMSRRLHLGSVQLVSSSVDPAVRSTSFSAGHGPLQKLEALGRGRTVRRWAQIRVFSPNLRSS